MPSGIRDEDVHRQARDPAGKSATTAIGPRRADAAELLAIARHCAEPCGGCGLTSDHGDLYDAQGLPR